MRSNRRKYQKLFLISFFVIALISLLVIDSYSPLGLEFLRTSWFGKIWQVFILPGEIVFSFPLLWVYQGICSLFGGCIGMLDGGPGEPYFFSAMSAAIGTLYAGILTGCVYGADWVRNLRT